MIKDKIKVGDLVIGCSHVSPGGYSFEESEIVGLVIDTKQVSKGHMIVLLAEGEVFEYPDFVLKRFK